MPIYELEPSLIVFQCYFPVSYNATGASMTLAPSIRNQTSASNALTHSPPGSNSAH